MIKKIKYGETSFPNGYNPLVVLFCYRPLAVKLALLLKNISFITPNKVTVLGLITFIFSTYLISFKTGNFKIFGLFLGPIWIFIDYLDGSLARIRGVASVLGKKLDALQDHLAFFFIPVSIYVSLLDQSFFYFLLLIFILFNQYLYAVGIRELFSDGQLPFFEGRPFERMNKLQKFILIKTKVNIGIHTLFQGDTLFFIYWICMFYNIHFLPLFHFLLWSIIRNMILFNHYLIKIKN